MTEKWVVKNYEEKVEHHVVYWMAERGTWVLDLMRATHYPTREEAESVALILSSQDMMDEWVYDVERVEG